MRAVVVGSGFIGSAVVDALQRRGHEVTVAHAPRLETPNRSLDDLVQSAVEIASTRPPIDSEKVDVVVNCAGLATPARGLSDQLVGANALLPAVLSATIAAQGTSCRLVQVSSAAVQGAGVLDESRRLSPWSAYSRSKALGELALSRLPVPATIYRPASVHGPDRPLTKSLSRFARSRWSSVGGRGEGCSPVAHVANVADGIAFIAEHPCGTDVVLQPSDGFTCAEILRTLGERDPRRIPSLLARVAIGALASVGHLSPFSAALARRLEVTWLGQEQQARRLRSLGWKPVVGTQEWRTMAVTSESAR